MGNSLVIKMKAFVAVIALCAAMAKGQIIANAGYGYAGALPYAAGYAGYAAPAAVASYAAAPSVAYAAAPVYGGVYAANYDPSVAYANLYPAAEPYVHQEI